MEATLSLTSERFRNAGFRPAPRTSTLPLFQPADIPAIRAAVGGYRCGDEVWFHPPGRPGVRIKARVLAALPTLKTINLRVEGQDAVVTLNPLDHAHMISRRGASQNPVPA
ncbi:hypothetical protein [Aestuariivirga litoralis]|uniref:hypothetical protein n=1 Tax=Aestuariivirga litoralis TaxID=2650924 RepID=UPI0018C80DE8|nr:hypothetical protein [Aestuariivirga litoralis]MBG1232998.1 hypothetical protein [Aestuariivirga litoralis]